ncbi:MAG: 30S ribosome-binding factor RbfA [Synergistaceae bacterium]|jgi:ribosome-binding factor A|nr:30S ribosome-binding factor RbfA [Synergistaceae bacterium]
MATFRIERLNREFLRLLAGFIANGLKNDVLRDVILIHVDCSRDLSHARVYYTVLDDVSVPLLQSALNASSGRMRGFLGREMHIRQIPELHFIFDDSERHARDIDALIDRVIKEDGQGKSP